MKTIIIYSSIEEDLFFFYNRRRLFSFEQMFINSGLEPEKERKACELLYDENGNFKISMSNDISLLESKNWDKAAIITFLP